MGWSGRILLAVIVVFVLLQVVRPTIPAKPASATLQVPPQVRQILENSCYSCHSDQRRLSWFDQIQPGYWLVRHDILAARQHLDFSALASKPAAAQKAALFEAVNMIQLGAMPLPRYTRLHPEARVTPEELAALKAYLAPWAPYASPSPGTPPAQQNGAPARMPAPVSLEAVRPEWNGLPLDSAFESWKPISTTDRGDNRTFRFVLGNDIAVAAAKSGNLSPWPDGSRFAKIAWQQQLGADGLLHPGKFVQVELMVKDHRLYQQSDGWDWGRWRGLDLKPYGTSARFVDECTGCHQPVRGNDFVYTLPMTRAHGDGIEVVNHRAATLPANLPYQPLEWHAITMYVDPENHTMATLYGNDTAMLAIHARTAGTYGMASAPMYPPGAVLALVSWRQREDPHWFGARIPDVPLSVEFVESLAGGQGDRYRRFAGSGLMEDHPGAQDVSGRRSFILGLPPAPLP